MRKQEYFIEMVNQISEPISNQEVDMLREIIKDVKLARENMLNSPKQSASEPVTVYLMLADTLLAQVEKKINKVA